MLRKDLLLPVTANEQSLLGMTTMHILLVTTKVRGSGQARGTTRKVTSEDSTSFKTQAHVADLLWRGVISWWKGRRTWFSNERGVRLSLERQVLTRRSSMNPVWWCI